MDKVMMNQAFQNGRNSNVPGNEEVSSLSSDGDSCLNHEEQEPFIMEDEHHHHHHQQHDDDHHHHQQEEEPLYTSSYSEATTSTAREGKFLHVVKPAVHDDDDDDDGVHVGVNHQTCHNDNDNDKHQVHEEEQEEEEEDLYANVRERMEALAAHDKETFGTPEYEPMEPEIPYLVGIATYWTYFLLVVCGCIRDIFSFLFKQGRYVRVRTGIHSDNWETHKLLLSSWENFFRRRLFHRGQDCFNRPLAGPPAARNIQVLERVSRDGNKTMTMLGSIKSLKAEDQLNYTETPYFCESKGRVARNCMNLASYNYLGFADDWKETCEDDVCDSLTDLPVSSGSSRTEFGTTCLHREVEKVVARFLGKEDAMAMNMGFNTNATTIPALVSKGDLIISDQLNHTSIVSGARASGASIKVFRHNDTEDLDKVLRKAIVEGQNKTGRAWNKILVVVEGIYSMEGEYCDLPNVVRICKKYGAYVYLDEAHSIGAMGPTGRGCCEYTGVDPADVDILMGTFTKSFGGMGGYIAASKEVINFLRNKASGSVHHNSLSPAVCQQIITSFKIIMGEDGTDIGRKKLRNLRDNSNYFRMRLQEMGLHVLGNYDSPIIPVMLYHPAKFGSFSFECFKRGLAVIVVGFPAVPMMLTRVRFCISAAHTREDLDRALDGLDDIADILNLRYAKYHLG